MALTGLTLTATNGVLNRFERATVTGLGMLSPSDNPDSTFMKEIDFYNDAQEQVLLKFDTAQSRVSLTLQQVYQENQFDFTPTPEKVYVQVFFTDGTNTTSTYQATTTALPGELSITLDSADFGGRKIVSVNLLPSDDWPPLGTPKYEGTYNATHPYSEFVLKAVSYVANTAKVDNSCDFLSGGRGNDKLYGGGGEDKLLGNWGNDLLIGGSGNNKLYGGEGCDVFAFGWDSTGHDTIYDFTKRADKLALFDGITVTSSEIVSNGTLIHLSSGGDVLILGVKTADVASFF